jgi:hypothetical protein
MYPGTPYQDPTRNDTELLDKVQALVEDNTNWYHAWFFRLRLADEIRRASRYRHRFSMILLKLSAPPRGSMLERDYFNLLLWEIADRTLQAPDVPAFISDEEYAVLLPETPRSGAEAIALHLQRVLDNYGPSTTTVEFPVNATDVRELWRCLRISHPSNVVSFADFKLRKDQRFLTA